MPNQLAASISPYLRQHADNPIDWRPWGEDAFAEARRRDVPILLSVGYSACHWCHVMAHETFSDAEVADLVNASFVAVKVDREEHPDVDSVYMTATQALTGHGGWPNTVFLTPAGDPFFAGTYFPPTPRDGLPSFSQVVEALAAAWASRRDEVVGSASEIARELAALAPVTVPQSAPEVRRCLDAVGGDYDQIHGGFGSAPKFPTPTVLDALLVKGDPNGLDIAQWTLEAMARGGIHDQVGGGFHRYSVDAGWVVPHFEKMLYDNALLLGTYTRCWRRTADHDPVRRALFERALFGIAEWVSDELTLPGGGFAASLDADSCDAHGRVHEGIYYVWNPELLADALGERDAEWARQVFHVSTAGTFDHGLSTLQLRGNPDPDRLDRVLARLKVERASRFAPARDDKVVAAWNGLMIDSLVTAGMVFGKPEWLTAARGAADHLTGVHVVGGELRRTSLDGQAGTASGVTEDYACVGLGLARLAGALGEPAYLRTAEWLLDQAIERFGADDGGFFDGPAGMYVRPREMTDNPTPSATASMVAALRLVAALSGRGDLAERAEAASRTLWATVARLPRHSGWALADLIESDEARRGLGRAEVVIVRGPDDGPVDRLSQAAWRMAPAGSAIVTAVAGTTGFGDLFAERVALDGVPTAYVCRGRTCLEPVTDYAGLRTPLWTRL